MWEYKPCSCFDIALNLSYLDKYLFCYKLQLLSTHLWKCILLPKRDFFLFSLHLLSVGVAIADHLNKSDDPHMCFGILHGCPSWPPFIPFPTYLAIMNALACASPVAAGHPGVLCLAKGLSNTLWSGIEPLTFWSVDERSTSKCFDYWLLH